MSKGRSLALVTAAYLLAVAAAAGWLWAGPAPAGCGWTP